MHSKIDGKLMELSGPRCGFK